MNTPVARRWSTNAPSADSGCSSDAPDCNLFTRRLGPGGACPHCDEPVVLDDLVDSP